MEEQFYLLWPLALMVLTRFSRRAMRGVTMLLLFASLAAGIWMTAVADEAAFFLLPFRAWELLLGGVLAMGSFPAFRCLAIANIACAAGIAMIVYAVSHFPNRRLSRESPP